MTTTFQANQLPVRATCWHDECYPIPGSAAALGYFLNTAVYYNHSYTAGGSVVNDGFSHSIFLKAGTYNFYTLGNKFSNRGILTWYLDGIPFATQDLYNATSVVNLITNVGSVTVLSDGYHVLKGVVLSNNASSSGYYASLTKYWLSLASDPTPNVGPIFFQTNNLPVRFTCFHDQALISTGNALSTTVTLSQFYAYYASQSSPGLNNTFYRMVFLRGGVPYNFNVLGVTDVDCGQITWSLDGTPFIVSQEWYAAATAYNVVKSGIITLATDGYHALQGQITAKNVSSSNYYAKLTKYWFSPQSGD